MSKKAAQTQEVFDETPEEIMEEMSEYSEFLPKKDLFRLDEVAGYLHVDVKTIRNWIDHGHLTMVEKHRGQLRVPRLSILRCRFVSRIKQG